MATTTAEGAADPAGLREEAEELRREAKQAADAGKRDTYNRLTGQVTALHRVADRLDRQGGEADE